MEVREERGVAIADKASLKRKGPFWVVPSQTGNGSYIVDREGESPTCTCPDFETRNESCKHVFAVEHTIRREMKADGSVTITESVKVTYGQNWSAYNAAQTTEKERVAVLLKTLCGAIDNPVQTRGRPRLPLSDTVFAAVMKVYGGQSGRRSMVDMNDYAAKGYIDKAPHYNSIFNCLEDASLTAILKTMIEESAAPLKNVECDFAVDSSGFSTSIYERWFDHKYGREQKQYKWVKAHIMVGVKTNVVTSVEVTSQNVGDYPMLAPLVKRTAARFEMKEVSADKAYLGKSNLDAIDSVGAFPLIPFKSNNRGNATYKAPQASSALWIRMHGFFTHNRQEFLEHYHKRSNVETTFSMIKAKFGGSVRSKTLTAQVNVSLPRFPGQVTMLRSAAATRTVPG